MLKIKECLCFYLYSLVDKDEFPFLNEVTLQIRKEIVVNISTSDFLDGQTFYFFFLKAQFIVIHIDRKFSRGGLKRRLEISKGGVNFSIRLKPNFFGLPPAILNPA